MTPEQLLFAQRSRRLYRWAERLHALPLPRSLKNRLSRALGRFLSPYRADLPKVLAGLQLGLGFSLAEAKVNARAWLASHGLFAVSLFDYPRMDEAWVRRHVTVEQPEVLARLVETGGLVLTYHSFHHNTLGVVLGQSGTRIYGVAASEKQAPDAPWVGKYTRLINAGSAARFAGGRYLFTDEMRQLVLGVREAFHEGHSVVTLCDNPTPPGVMPPVTVMGRQVHVGTGVVELARDAQAPVFFALLYPDLRGGFCLALKEAGVVLDLHGTVQEYFEFLEEVLRRAPWAWQGWAWWGDL